MTIKFNKISEKATEPVRTENSGAGYCMTAAQISTDVNERGQLIMVYHTGIGIELPEGYAAYIRPDNSIDGKTLRMIDAPCAVKTGLDKEIVARFIATTDVIPAIYNMGDTVCQLVIERIEDIEFVEFIDATEKYSAATGSQSLPETEGEPTNFETATEASGGEKVPEEA